MSDLRVIKEPIHNYIAVSELEHALINDPLFLRLQHISQNGLAFLTYPSNRTSRFIHSLGAMHLGGEMIRSAVFNSDRSERDAFMRAFGEVLSEAESNVNVRLDQIGKWLAEQNDACYRHNAFDPKDPNSVPLIILFQSVRIACVMHDLGHPPISHTTEGVMKSMLDSFRIEGPVQVTYKEFVDALTGIGRGESGQLHELVGSSLTYYVFSELGGGGAQSDYGKFCFWIAVRIANHELAVNDPFGVFRCMHAIVSSDGFDADRGDYVLRDGHASSFEFGQYDLTRILDNLKFVRDSKGTLLMLASTTASALESFFLERYRIWRWLVFHPNVIRAEIALARALAILFEIA
jgi:HD superfamily phosphohydrolase